MKVNLLYTAGDFCLKDQKSSGWEEKFNDLEMNHLFHAMSGENAEILLVCRQIMSTPLQSAEDILYRQEILKDCLSTPDIIRQIYDICRAADKKRRLSWCSLTSPYLSSVYSSAVDLIKIYLGALVKIRKIIELQSYHSKGLSQFTALLCNELSDTYLNRIRELETELAGRDNILISAKFGSFLQGTSYIQCRNYQGISKLQWLSAPSYTLADNDIKGAEDFGMRRDRALNEVVNAMAKAAESLQAFTNQLRQQLAFYVGALNLHERLEQMHLSMCFPVLSEKNIRRYDNLYDVSLPLLSSDSVVGNTLECSFRQLYLITGANQGGKTTFLRSVGQCQLMAQCGLFVCAESCEIPLRKCLYTHFKKEEDSAMESGKLDEELKRMSRIIDHLKPGGMLLLNESFSSTSDLEGSEILGQITKALLERKIEIFSVTHLINYALSFAENENTFCLRAERKENGERTFRMKPGKPLKTAFGKDIFDKIFPSV